MRELPALPPKTITLLGSTGSIGTQVLDIAAQYPELFIIRGLSCGSNVEKLAQQVVQFNPTQVAIADAPAAEEFRRLMPHYNGQVVVGPRAMETLCLDPSTNTVIVGVVGTRGLTPTLKALEAGKKVLTANKETFVAGGHLVAPYLDQIVPLDSEHSAIFQCLRHENTKDVETLFLTASGGPFRDLPLDDFSDITVDAALKHPNWVMGPKVTIDSATLMNKALEVIEAHWLFGVPYNKIQVLVHPQSLVHGGIEFTDGSQLFQMGAPDMHVPILVAMAHPYRLSGTPKGDSLCQRLDLTQLSRLDFEMPDLHRFPCLELAYTMGHQGPGATAVLNAANEAVVEAFLEKKIPYTQIYPTLKAVTDRYLAQSNRGAEPTLEEVLALTQWAATQVDEVIGGKVASSSPA